MPKKAKVSVVGSIFQEAMQRFPEINEKIPFSAIRDLDRLIATLNDIPLPPEVKETSVVCFVDFLRNLPSPRE